MTDANRHPEGLVDQETIFLSAEALEAFSEAVDREPRDNPRLSKLMAMDKPTLRVKEER